MHHATGSVKLIISPSLCVRECLGRGWIPWREWNSWCYGEYSNTTNTTSPPTHTPLTCNRHVGFGFDLMCPDFPVSKGPRGLPGERGRAGATGAAVSAYRHTHTQICSYQSNLLKN